MKIFALILVIVGAFITYGAKYITQNIIKKDDANNKYTATIKVIGYIIALIGAILIFVFA